MPKIGESEKWQRSIKLYNRPWCSILDFGPVLKSTNRHEAIVQQA